MFMMAMLLKIKIKPSHPPKETLMLKLKCTANLNLLFKVFLQLKPQCTANLKLVSKDILQLKSQCTVNLNLATKDILQLKPQCMVNLEAYQCEKPHTNLIV